jgi:hypothetical protein
MLVYPQLTTGALCQYPLRKTRRARTVSNRAADGSAIKLADPYAEITQWRLDYSELSDTEAAALRDFFAAAEGSLNEFTFLDPAGNLLAWSEQLDNAVWQKDPLLTIVSGVADPHGGTKAWQLSNGGGAEQGLTQTLAAPGDYRYCLSAYVRSASATSAKLVIATQNSQQAVGTTWSRAVFTATGGTGAASVLFGIAAAAGANIEVYGLQVEAQAGASVYRATTRGGVYSEAHLASDELDLTWTSVNRHACTVNIIHANHI